MSKIYEASKYTTGFFSLILHPTKGLATIKDKGELTAKDADTVVSKAIEVAARSKVELDRWSFYVEGVNEKLSEKDKFLPVSEVQKALKAGYVATIECGRYSHPRVTLRPKGSTGRKQPTRKPAYKVIA